MRAAISGVMTHRPRARPPAGGRSLDAHMHLIIAHIHVLDHDGGIETRRHGDARIGEFPLDAAHPCIRVRDLAIRQACKRIPMHGYGIHCARERVRQVGLVRHVFSEHAAIGFGKRHALHALMPEGAGQGPQHSCDSRIS